MGVYGLWRLLDATGKQVPLETLEGKVLAIDISIWIHQVLQGYQDRFGNPKPNAHLLGLFHRICKLLYFKIKPVFVFDGGVPMLKKNTIALRRKQKSMAKNKAQQMRTELINNLIKHSTVKTVLGSEKQATAASGPPELAINVPNKRVVDDMFKLPDLPSTSASSSTAPVSLSDEYDSDSSDEPSPRKQTKWIGNIHSVNVSSSEFRALPADMRYEILTDLKETRKQNSWGRLHEMPEESNEFSGFQLKRLLKRRLVQESLESAEKEMGGRTLTLDELEKLLKEQGIATNVQNCAYRIAADNTTRLIYMSDKNAYLRSTDASSNSEDTRDAETRIEETVGGPSKATPIIEDLNEYELDGDWDSDVEITGVNDFTFAKETSSDAESEAEANGSRSKKYLGSSAAANSALPYMLEYSGLPEKQIVALLEQKKKETTQDGRRTPTIPSQFDLLQAKYREAESNSENAQRLASLPELNEEDAKLDSADAVKPIEAPEAESSVPNLKEAPVNEPSEKTADVSSETQAEPQDVAVISSSDSDSDDFIEIEDAPEALTSANINKAAAKEAIQITFRSDEKVEDDMFADVFETATSESNLEANTRNALNTSQLSSRSPTILTEPNSVVEPPSTVQVNSSDANEGKTIEPEEAEANDKSGIEDSTIPKEVANHFERRSDSTKGNADHPERGTDSAKENAEAVDIEPIASKETQLVAAGPAKKISPLPANEEELLFLQAQLEEQQAELMANIGKLERQGIDISDQIRIEAQELLRLFGIPYIVAPMEAEAQCAYLEQIRLTDGTITDDSDIWLFGGQCVYKNFFDNGKKVLEFRSSDIEHHFKLTRNEMIRLALLVGSDYTTGLSGIGPVTALEILAAFPSEGENLLQGLTNFCSWIGNGRAAGPGRTTLRNKLQDLQVQKGFPSQAVVQAYLFPKVDESRETFSWGKPNTILLADYAKRKFGWDRSKFEKMVAPLLKRLEEKQSQSKISAYFKTQTVPKSIEMTLSKRVQKAVQRLNNEAVEDAAVAERVEQSAKKKRPAQKRKKKESKIEEALIECPKPKVANTPAPCEKNVDEYIPQREKDKANALKKKLHAIEVLRKSKQGLCKTKKVKRYVRKVKKEAELSESDSSS